MKDTRIDNPNIIVKDKRIVELDHIVTEVKESEEWEEVEMNILEVGINHGISQGIGQGKQEKLIEQVCKKLIKGCNVQETADMLEEDVQTIQRIYEAAEKYAPEYDAKKILKELKII